MATGERCAFDKVVFAATPDQVLRIVSDPTDDEIRRFRAWHASEIETLVHTDISIYKHFGVTYFAEFDVFQNDENGDCGYNAYLDRLCGVPPERDNHYSLAYNLEARIRPDKIIHRQKHTTPLYTVDAVRFRPEIIETNGENHTFHAGAWLYDGLHEGAITSAVQVSKQLGGLRL